MKNVSIIIFFTIMLISVRIINGAHLKKVRTKTNGGKSIAYFPNYYINRN